MRFPFMTAAAVVLLATAGCEFSVKEADNETEANAAVQESPGSNDPQQADTFASDPAAIQRALQLAAQGRTEEQRAQLRQQALAEHGQLAFVVDLSDREIRIMNGQNVVRTHPVSVGTEEWPTPTGSWEFHRVDINPVWNPPKENWAKEETRKGAGDPENPMGRARLVYRMPNTVHGTDDTQSLGKAASHGSIRVANEVVLNLAQMLLKAGGSWAGPDWFQQMTQNRTTEYQVDLEKGIPIKVQE